MEWVAISSYSGLPGPGIEPMSPVSSALQADSLSLSQQGSPQKYIKENEKQK